MHRLEHRIPPPVLWLVAISLTTLVDRLDLDGSPLDGVVADVVAALLVVVALAFSGAGLLAFNRSGTTFDPHRIDEASALVVDGVYRRTRNPMYLGLVILSVAWGLLVGSVIGTVIGTGFLVAVLTRLQIIPEERALGRRFGEDYERYRRSVRRWI